MSRLTFNAIPKSKYGIVAGLKEFFKNNNPVHKAGLFHYTKIAAFRNILSSKALILSDTANLNDRAEKKSKGLFVLSFSHGRIESVAMWGLYSSPLTEALRIKFVHSELVELLETAKRERVFVPVLRNRREDGVYKILTECDAVEIINEPKISDVLYADYSSGKYPDVMVRWNGNVIRIPRKDLKDSERNALLGFVKYSGWAYERETRICVRAKIRSEDVSRYVDDGWELDASKIALLLSPQAIKTVSVIAGPCMSKDELKKIVDKSGPEGLHVSGIKESKLLGLIKGGIFCKQCKKLKECSAVLQEDAQY